jgi:hypothetical protein
MEKNEKKVDFGRLAQEQYDTLLKQEEELKCLLDKIKNEMKPLKAYLIEAGLLEIEQTKRGRKKNPPTEEQGD